MLSEQLFLGDSIQFLNAHDHSNFIKTINSFLAADPHLKPHKKLPEDPSIPLHLDMSTTLPASEKLIEIKENAHFISGIFTASPIDQAWLNIRNEDDLVTRMVNRPANLLCFGLIRANKGIEKALEFLEKSDSNFNSTVFIVGKVMNKSAPLFRKIITKIFGISQGELKKIALNCVAKMKPEIKKADLEISDFSTIPTDYFKDDKIGFNQFCQNIYDTISHEKDKHLNVELCTNVSEEQLKEIAMKCRYAIKMDHKGMANNASTIVSCLGLFLPTFTSSGLVTGNDFRDPQLHRTQHQKSITNPFRLYSATVFMPKKEYHREIVGAGQRQKIEVWPNNFTADDLLNILLEDLKSPDLYRQRIQTIATLHQNQIFNVASVARVIVDKIFNPLCTPRMNKNNN
jgi:hypothetical protein